MTELTVIVDSQGDSIDSSDSSGSSNSSATVSSTLGAVRVRAEAHSVLQWWQQEHIQDDSSDSYDSQSDITSGK